jgi:peptidoglycan hydrolase-like protein with peptidoglycan-binding domain
MVACRWPNGSMTRISSGFGPRKSPGNIGSTMHRGADFPGLGAVRNIADGVVKVVGTPGGWSGGGRQVWVQHDGFYSRHAHLASYAVRVGDRIPMAQIVGAADTTGSATGSHDHLEIGIGEISFSNSGQVDPVAFIQARLMEGSPAGGVSQDWVYQLQVDLNTVGYPLAADGDYGPATAAAVTAFQNEQGITVDGDAGVETLARLKAAITKVQEDLIYIGYTLTKDGYSGPQTVGAIKDLQAKNGLTPDGIIGPATRAIIVAKTSQPVGHNAIPDKRATADIQRLVGVNPDGIWGPLTTEAVVAWQKAHPPLVADGVWGDASDAVGFPVTAFVPIPVTQQFDVATWKAIQASLGFTGVDVDGDPGPKTITALQKAVGVPEEDQDGVLGPQTWRSVQASVGVRQDGNPGPDTAAAVPTLMNAGGKFLPGVIEVEEPKPAYPQPVAPTYPGAVRWGHAWKSSNRQDVPKQLLIWHYWGTDPVPSNDAEWDYMMRLNDPNGASANWQINPDGTVFEPVPEDDYRAWTTGPIDHQAGTVEMGTATGAEGGWKFSEESLEAMARVFAWHATKHGYPIQKGEVGPNNVVIRPGLVGHNETPAGQSTGTPCPGPDVQYQWVIDRARVLAAPPDGEPIMVEIPVERVQEILGSVENVAEALREALD